MATVTYDSQSFLVDGRRVWIVSGTLDYFRIPRALWRERIRDAAEAGLNSVLVRSHWATHEPRRGEFHGDGEADIAEFVRLVGEAGLRCILRIGPFVGTDLDLGGMPSWLLANPDCRLREGNPAFLEAVSRYFGWLLTRLAPHSASNGGPIVLVQIEHEWYCGNDRAAADYLLELSRFVREHDFDLPLINTNNLFQEREETINTWSGRDRMLVDLRQLRNIYPHTPLFVGDFFTGSLDVWDEPRTDPLPPIALMQRLTQVLAGGAGFNLTPFHGGTNFGFIAGRNPGGLDRFATTSADAHAPLGEAGERTPTWWMLRRVCTFASQFGRVLAAIQPVPDAAVLSLEPMRAIETHDVEEMVVANTEAMTGDEPAAIALPPRPLSIVHLHGSQGEIIFAIGGEDPADQRAASILLPSGKTLDIDLGDQPVGWFVLDVHLAGRSKLNWTNLNAFATAAGGRILVVYGVAGHPGVVCINYSQLDADVPDGPQPRVEMHEEITVVICNNETIDSTFIRGDEVYVGVEGFNADGSPRPWPGATSYFVVGVDGEFTRYPVEDTPSAEPEIAMEGWTLAPIRAYVEGSAPRFARISGPTTQEACASGSGYGFLRLGFQKGTNREHRLFIPHVGDRVHLYVNGEFQCVLGHGPGAEGGAFKLSLPRSNPQIVALIDNLGRYGGGNDMAEGKGILSHIYDVNELDLQAPEIVDGPTRRPFDMHPFLDGLHGNAMTSGRDLLFQFDYRRKTPLILEIKDAATPAIVVLNDEPIGWYSGHTGRPLFRCVLDEPPFRRGKNELRLAPLVPAEESDLPQHLHLWETTAVVSTDAEWAFAKWEQPRDADFVPLSKSLLKEVRNQPAWFRLRFQARGLDPRQPLWFEPHGLTKGQIYLNGHNVGRYFCATHDGRPVGPQQRYYLPQPWLAAEDATNDLVIFEEHGHDPSKCTLVFGGNAFG